MAVVVGAIGLRDDGTLKIVPTKALPEINMTATDATATEAGTTTGQFTITSDVAAGASGISVAFIVSGTAALTSDYTINASPAIITQGNTSVVVTVTPVDDSDIEGDETVILTLANGIEYNLGSNVVDTVTITDDDTPPTSIHMLDTNNKHALVTLSNNDLTATAGISSWLSAASTSSKATGKNYFEIEIDKAAQNIALGLLPATNLGLLTNPFLVGSIQNSYGHFLFERTVNENGVVLVTLPNSYINGAIIGILLNLVDNELQFIVGGVLQSALSVSITNLNYHVCVSIFNTSIITVNFGASPFTNTIPVGYTSWDGSQTG